MIPLTPHVCRHSAAAGLLEAGADVATVQAILGHSSLATTQVYLRIADERVTAPCSGTPPDSTLAL